MSHGFQRGTHKKRRTVCAAFKTYPLFELRVTSSDSGHRISLSHSAEDKSASMS